MNKKKLKVSLSLIAIAGILSAIPVASYASQKNASKNEAKNEPKHEEAAPVKEEELALDIPKISESFGHLIGKNLDSLGFKFDMDKIIKGIQDSVLGKEPPMSESECIQAISQDQEKKFKKVAQQNLNDAEKFLESNSSKDGIVSIEEKKLQYKNRKRRKRRCSSSSLFPFDQIHWKIFRWKSFWCIQRR